MSEIKRMPAIAYIERNRLWYHPSSSTNIFQLDFPPEIVNDLEILNKDKFNELLKAFVGANKIEPANLMILLSPDVTFEKDLPEGLPVEIEGETKNFLNFLPFDETYSKPIKLGKTVKVVAANKELCNIITNAFQELEFQVTSLIPFSVLHQTIPELSTNLDLAFILNHADSVRQYNLFGGIEISNAGVQVSKNKTEAKDNKRLFAFVGIFVVLMLILGYVVYTNVIAPPSTPIPTSATLYPTRAPTAGSQATTGNQTTVSPSITGVENSPSVTVPPVIQNQ